MVRVVVNSDILHDGDRCALNGTWSWREKGRQVVESPEKLRLVKEKEERDVVVVRGISLLSESDALLRSVLTFNYTTYQHSTYSQNWYTVWSNLMLRKDTLSVSH